MRFGKKLGRLALPSQWPESTRDTRAHYLGDRKVHQVRWSTQRARAHVVAHGAEVSTQHPGKCTTGHWGPAVSAAALCQGQSSCLEVSDEEQTRMGPKYSDQSLICRGQSPKGDDWQHTNGSWSGKGSQNDLETHRRVWPCMNLKPLGFVNAEWAFQLCSPQTKATSHRNCYHHSTWSRSCWFAKLHTLHTI